MWYLFLKLQRGWVHVIFCRFFLIRKKLKIHCMWHSSKPLYNWTQKQKLHKTMEFTKMLNVAPLVAEKSLLYVKALTDSDPALRKTETWPIYLLKSVSQHSAVVHVRSESEQTNKRAAQSLTETWGPGLSFDFLLVEFLWHRRLSKAAACPLFPPTCYYPRALPYAQHKPNPVLMTKTAR